MFEQIRIGIDEVLMLRGYTYTRMQSSSLTNRQGDDVPDGRRRKTRDVQKTMTMKSTI